jgi:hypothetical protein
MAMGIVFASSAMGIVCWLPLVEAAAPSIGWPKNECHESARRRCCNPGEWTVGTLESRKKMQNLKPKSEGQKAGQKETS